MEETLKRLEAITHHSIYINWKSRKSIKEAEKLLERLKGNKL